MENFSHLSLPLILLSLSNSPNPNYLWGCYPAVLGVDPEKKVLSFLPAGWWRSALLFSKALHSLFPCPHASLHCSAHTLLLRPPLTSFYSSSSFPSFFQAFSCSRHLPCSQFPFWILLLPPQFTAFITQCSPEAIHPFSEFYCCCRTPKAGSSLYCRIQLLSRILTVAVHSSASAPFSAVQYFLSWQRSPMPPPKEGWIS